MSRLEKDHFMAQGVASKNCKAIYLMCLFFFSHFVSVTSLCSAQNMRERTKWVSRTWPNAHFLYYSVNILQEWFGSKNAGRALREWERQKTNQGAFSIGTPTAFEKKRRSFYLSKTQCLSHFQSSNHKKLSPCSKLHQVAEWESKRNEKWAKHPLKLQIWSY